MAQIGPRHCLNMMCARPIRQNGGGGRPRKYCSKPCRDAAAEARFIERTGRPRSHKRGGGVTAASLGPLVAWLRSGQDRRDDESADAWPRAHPRGGRVTPGWLLRPLDSTGPEAEPDVGTPGWLDRHRLY